MERGHHISIVLLFSVIISSAAQNADPSYLGCFHEHAVHNKPWNDVTRNVAGLMTIDACARQCASRRYLYSGLKNGKKCWCSSEPVYGVNICTGCCETSCEGDTSLKCGGADAYDIYEAVVDRRYLGCYKDKHVPDHDRIFQKKHYSDDQTTEKCIQFCASQNFPLSGTQYYNECFCGHGGYDKYGRCVSQSNCRCSMPCTGDQTEICGRGLAMSVYKTECRELGRWGSTCSNYCHCKDELPCDITTGKCPRDECAAGWHGSTCNEECEPGTYGDACAGKCECGNVDDCHKVTGKCDIGIQNVYHSVVPAISGLLGVLLLIMVLLLVFCMCRKKQVEDEAKLEEHTHEEIDNPYEYITPADVGDDTRRVTAGFQNPAMETGLELDTRMPNLIHVLAENDGEAETHYLDMNSTGVNANDDQNEVYESF